MGKYSTEFKLENLLKLKLFIMKIKEDMDIEE